MTKFLRWSARSLGHAGALGLALSFAQPALAIDWSGVQGKDVVVFYPGQASFEWALTQSDHSGNKKFREGKNCRDCHGGEEADMGALIVSGKKLEPTPIAGKRGSIRVNVKTAHDADNLYFRLEWPDAPAPAGPKMDPEHAIKATVMISNGAVAAAKRAGCWASCHDDMIGMASAPAGKEITKYLVRSRTSVTRQGGGENFKPAAELEKMMADSEYLEFWQARGNPGSAGSPADGHILERRVMEDPPVVNASAELADGVWTVVLSRKLSGIGGPHQDIVPGTVYHIGFAIHDGFAAHRFHDVSFEHTLVLDQGSADFVARGQ
jgi:hypothetical protein